MASDIGSIQPNPYLFNIENRKKRKAKLAHEIGAGAPCLKCGEKCAGFQLHFWRKVCQNCRCGKDDHDVEEEEEDIGQIVIGKLFERPIRTKEEEQQYSFGTDLEMVNEATGKKEKLKFDWVPPGVANNVAKRYMEMLPPEKRPVAGTEAAKKRRRQLEQQIPLYDMDESERCENLPPEELHNFQRYLEDVRTKVAGQASVQEIGQPVTGPQFTRMPTSKLDISREVHSRAPLSDLDVLPPPHVGSGRIDEQFNLANNNLSPQRAELDLRRCNEQNLQSHPNMSDSLGAMSIHEKEPYDARGRATFPSHLSQGATPFEASQHSGRPNLLNPYDPISCQVGHPKGFRSVSPAMPARNPQNLFESSDVSNLNTVQPKLKHLTAPQPYVAKSYEQNIVPEQYSSNLTTNKSPRKDPISHVQYQPFETPSYISSDDSHLEGKHLPNMVGRDGNILSSHAVQAPYAAHKETMIGPGYYAQDSNVTVLFPNESQMLGGQTKLIQGSSDELGNLFSCQFCEGSMIPGDVAVICERAGPGKYWHPQCFVCVTCNELLADLIYFYKDGKIFCGRHYTQAADIPRCKACDELIFGDTWTRAEDFDWHLHHYCCFICDTPLAGMKYVPDEKGFPHCMACHMSFKAKMCETCEDKISPSETRAGYRGYFYHATPHCFSCFKCRLPMIGKKFKMAKNWIFCSQDCIDASQRLLMNNPNPKEKLP